MNPEYIQKVGHAFLQHSGRGLMLSPRDQELVARWEKAGIPSDIVIQGIEAAFESKPARRVHSISFVSSSVERAAKTWRNRRIGAGDEGIDHVSEWDVALKHLQGRLSQAKAAQPDETLSGVFDLAIDEIQRIDREWRTISSYSIHDALESVEARIYEEALGVLPPLERLELERAVEIALDQESTNTPAIRAETRRAFTRRRLRQRVGLPVFEIDPSGGW
jgi:hypothetical protein